ncbi:hypothetical protein BH18ACI5_BH18ACI5_28360 [soil metagenome]
MVLLCAGAVLRVWQYLSNNSLWLDEAALARNIVERSPRELLQPLAYAQVAPAGFLLIEKGAVWTLGNTEWALRLFPLLCGLGALWIFWRVAVRILSGWTAVYATGLFALATPLVYFSSQVKQYSSDAAATTVLLAAAMWLRSASMGQRWHRAACVAALGAIVAWISQPALFVLTGIGAALLWSHWRAPQPRGLKSAIFVCGAWAVSASLSAALAVRNVSLADRDYLDWYWSNGLMPWPPTSLADVLWIWNRLTWLFGAFVTGLRRTNGGLGYPWSQVFVVLTVVGFVALWRQKRDAALMLLLPAVLTILAAALQLYPFSGRVVTFLVPALLIATAAGVAYVIDHMPARLQFSVPVLLAVAIGSPVYATIVALPPERTEHLRPVIAAIAQQRRADDGIYVYYGAGQSFLYYAPHFGFTPDGYRIGRCGVTDFRKYLRDLDRFRGRSRVWLVSTHAPVNAVEVRTMVGYLNAIGRRLQAYEEQATSGFASNAATAYLFDLSDPSRLGQASAETFAIPLVPVDPMYARWGCYGAQSTSGGL